MDKLIFIITKISKKTVNDNISGFAAQSCFYITLSFFPFFLVLMSLVHYLPFSADDLISLLHDLLPSQIEPMLEGLIHDIYDGSSITFTSLTTITTVWAAGKGFLAIIGAFNKIYDVPVKRNWFLTRLLSTIYTISFLLIIIATLLIFIFGNNLADIILPVSPYIASIIRIILNKKMLLFPAILLLVFLSMYTFIPNRRSSFAKELPGAVMSTVGWCLFSTFYSLYVEHSNNFSYMYGSLTTLIFALFWIYSCMLILFLGAELNIFLQQDKFIFRRRKHSHHTSEK